VKCRSFFSGGCNLSAMAGRTTSHLPPTKEAISVVTELRLKRRCLGMSLAADGAVYLADPEARRVYSVRSETFIEAVRRRQVYARRWHMVVPRRDCVLKTLSLPTTHESEVRQMLEFEVPGLMPAQSGEVCYDAMPLGPPQEGRQDVLVVLTPAGRLRARAKLLTDAGVVPETVIPSCVGLHRWLRACVADESADEYNALLAVDREHYHLVLESRGFMVASRSAAVEPADGIGLPDQVAEAQRWLGRLPNADGAPPLATMFLVGEMQLVRKQGRPDSDAASSGVGPAQRVVEPSIEMVAEQPGAPPSMVQALSALGACLPDRGWEGRPLNLAPREWIEKRQRRRLWLDRAITAASVALAVACLCGYLTARNVRLAWQRDALVKQIEPIRDVAGALEAKKNQVRAIRSQMAIRPLPLEILMELHRRVPQNVFLSQLVMDLKPGASEVTLRGTARSLELAFVFPLLLEKSALFADVWPDGAQQVSRGNDTLVEYGCRCRIDVAAAARARAAAEAMQAAPPADRPEMPHGAATEDVL